MLRPQRLKTGFLGRVQYFLRGIGPDYIRIYNAALDDYDSGRYSEAWGRIKSLMEAETPQNPQDVALLLISLSRGLEPENALKALDYAWKLRSGVRKPAIKTALYEQTLGLAETLDPKKEYLVNDREESAVSLLIRLWESDAPESLKDIVERTSYLLERVSPNDRRRFRDAMQMLEQKIAKETRREYQELIGRVESLETRMSLLEAQMATKE